MNQKQIPSNGELRQEYLKRNLVPPPLESTGTDDFKTFLCYMFLVEHDNRQELREDIEDVKQNGCSKAEDHVQVFEDVKGLKTDKRDRDVIKVWWETKGILLKATLMVLGSIASISVALHHAGLPLNQLLSKLVGG